MAWTKLTQLSSNNIYRGHIFGREFVGGVRDEETSLSHGTVPDHHTLDGLHFQAVALSRKIFTLTRKKERA